MQASLHFCARIKDYDLHEVASLNSCDKSIYWLFRWTATFIWSPK